MARLPEWMLWSTCLSEKWWNQAKIFKFLKFRIMIFRSSDRSSQTEFFNFIKYSWISSSPFIIWHSLKLPACAWPKLNLNHLNIWYSMMWETTLLLKLWHYSMTKSWISKIVCWSWKVLATNKTSKFLYKINSL